MSDSAIASRRNAGERQNDRPRARPIQSRERLLDRARQDRTYASSDSEQARLPLTVYDGKKNLVTTAQFFALWRALGELSTDPAAA